MAQQPPPSLNKFTMIRQQLRQAVPSYIPPQTHLEVNLKASYLKKKGFKRSKWAKRWFVLRPTKLCYYLNDKEYELLSIIQLKDIHNIGTVEYKSRENVFALVCIERTYYVQASSKEEMVDWICYIKAVIKDGAKIATGVIPFTDIQRLVQQLLSDNTSVDSIPSQATFVSPVQAAPPRITSSSSSSSSVSSNSSSLFNSPNEARVSPVNPEGAFHLDRILLSANLKTRSNKRQKRRWKKRCRNN